MRKVIGLFSLFIVIAAVVAVGYYGYEQYEKTLDHTGKKAVGIQVTMKNKKIRSQAGKEELYLENFEKEGYSIEKPYIIQNPYNRAPLTALVMFRTEEEAKISLKVKGRTEQTDITHQFNQYEKTHEIPVLGLRSNTNNEVILTAETKDGKKTSSTLHIQTNDLPEYIGNINVKKLNAKKVDIGDSALTFVVPSTKFAYAFDELGDIRWYSSKYNSHVFKVLENGHLLYLSKKSNSADTYNVLIETDFLGKLYRVYDFNGANANAEASAIETTMIHHDAIELPNHNLLLTVNDDSNFVEDTMIEINRDTGDIEKVINLRDVLPADFHENYSATKTKDGRVDWFHQNSIFYDNSDDSIIISGRNQDIVMKMDYKTDQIKWILAAHENWPSEYKKYLLKPIGNVKFNGGQHTAIELPDQDQNPDTIDVLLYDNNVVVSRGNKDLSKKYSRAVQYRIDEKKKTVEEVWAFGEHLGEEYFTNVVGSTSWLDDTNHRLINFGYLDQDTRSAIFEVNEQGEVIMEADVTDFPLGARAYRSERFDLYNKNWKFELKKNTFFVKAYKKILE